MSTSKSQKAELVAIYRLEFYKKQSNWKLSSSRKPKTQKKTAVKEILNATYNVEEKSQNKDQSDPLNIAFVDSDSDKNQKVTKSPNSPELSQEWQEPVNIWPQITSHSRTIDSIKPRTHCTKQRLINLQKAADLVDLENNQIKNDFCNNNTDCTQNIPTCNNWPQDTNSPENCSMSPQNKNIDINLPHSSQNINTLSNCYIPPQSSEGLGWNEHGEFEGNWPIETAIWVGAGHMARDMCFQAEDFDAVDGITPVIYPDECPVAPDELPWSLDMDGNTSVDSAGEFMRGADGVPHSSEIDVSLPNCVQACDVSFSSLSRLSSQQLVLAAQLHSRVLRRLLLESQTRQKLRSQSLSTTDFSYEEFPTRDVGHHAHCGDNVLVKDVVVAGSHKNVGGGRGRGRLPSSVSLKP